MQLQEQNLGNREGSKVEECVNIQKERKQNGG